jgi:hypothetical protein
MLGLSAEADLSGPGAIALVPDAIIEIRHIIGGVRWPSGQPVSEVHAGDQTLNITGEAGAKRRLPFRSDFLDLPE